MSRNGKYPESDKEAYLQYHKNSKKMFWTGWILRSCCGLRFLVSIVILLVIKHNIDVSQILLKLSDKYNEKKRINISA